MDENYAIVVNTHSSCKDVWPMFFGQLEIHYPDIKTYVFTDNCGGIDSKYHTILYNNNDKFRTQYLKCIKQVKEDFIMYMNEDYILYKDVNIEKINEYLNIMIDKSKISFIRLTLGPNITEYKHSEDLYFLNNEEPYFFSQTAGIWRKSDLLRIHELGPDTHIGVFGGVHGHFEVDANTVCQSLNMVGLVAYNGEPKRGTHHYDSNVFPYIATAIVKGKWDVGTYPKELPPLLTKYKIDKNIRGVI